MTNLNSGEVGSIGELGTSRRPEGRLYHNATIYHEELDSVRDTFAGLLDEARADQSIGRVVFRGIVSPLAMNDLSRHLLASHLEVAQPLLPYNEPGWLVYLAANRRNRQPIHAVDSMVDTTGSYIPPADFDAHRLPENVTHIEAIPEPAVGQLHTLWQPFDWSLAGVAERAGRVAQNGALSPEKRDTWFSGLQHASQLICAATAERITYQGGNGPFNLIESTEWRTHPEHLKEGYTSRNLWQLNRQIRRDMSHAADSEPLIFAETNFMTSAYKAGIRAGFTIPHREYAPQIITQNVSVNDGLEPRGLRDFVYLSVPAGAQS